jgi:hypothetical protein
MLPAGAGVAGVVGAAAAPAGAAPVAAPAGGAPAASPAISTMRRPPDAGGVNGCDTSRSPSTTATAV